MQKKNDVVKKLVYDKLVAKVNSINSSAFVLKTMIQVKQNQKKKFLMLAVMFKKQVIMPK